MSTNFILKKCISMTSVCNVCLVLCDLFIVNVKSMLDLTPDHREIQALPYHTLPSILKFSALCLTVDRYKQKWFEDTDVDTLISSLIGH